jgi:Flp pilus assembly protein TadG
MKSELKSGFRLGARWERLRSRLGAFRLNKRGNVAIITALTAVPLVCAVGCVVDYSMASLVKTKLQAAADAASLATVSINSSVVSTAQGMSGNGAIANGSTTAINYFNANLSSAPETNGYTNLNSSASVTKSGLALTATISFTAQVPTFFMGIIGYKNIAISGTSTASYSLPAYINFYLMLDVSGSMSFPSTAAEQARLMAVNPDNLTGSNGYPQGCQFACHFEAQGACSQSGNPGQGPYPASGHSYSGYVPNPSPGGYCQGFLISRLGTTPTSFPAGETNQTGVSGYNAGGTYVNWTNSPVSTCSTAGTTSCIQLRADAVGYAVNALLSQATATESSDNVSNQFHVGLFPFIQYLCTSSAGSSNSCSVGLTTNLTGGTITTFAADLASLLDTGQNATLGSGGTHFENALSEMNSFITSVGTGSSTTDALPYVFIVTDGSQDYQTQSNGNWGSQNGTAPNGSWVATSPSLPCTLCGIPNQNSATVMPGFSPNNEPNSTNECTTLKNRGITIAILYIPYNQISDPNANFAGNEDGYANANIPNIPAALQSCASPNFFYTADSPADIQSALVTMFEQAVSTAHITD